MTVRGCHQFQLTRNSDLFLDEEELQGVKSLRMALQGELSQRNFGDGVRLEVSDACPPHVTEVRAVVRRPLDVAHDKLRVVIHRDFLDYGAVAEAFDGIDACLWCLGISVRQVSGAPTGTATITRAG